MHTVGEKPPAHIVEAGKDKAKGEGAAEGAAAAGGPATIASPGGAPPPPAAGVPGQAGGPSAGPMSPQAAGGGVIHTVEKDGGLSPAILYMKTHIKNGFGRWYVCVGALVACDAYR